MKQATLVQIVRGYGAKEEVLLSKKKKAEIGTDTVNGPGGKVEPGETPLQCAARETEEEMGIRLLLKNLRLRALINFYAAGVLDFQVFTYRARKFSGTPRETESMFMPQWYKVNNLPLDKMLESDRMWFERVIKAPPGPVMEINVYYKQRAKDFERIEFLNLP